MGAEPIQCDIGGGIGDFCRMGKSNTIELSIHHPSGKACILLATKKVTTKKLREVLWILKDSGEFNHNFKVVPPGIEMDVQHGGFVTTLKLQTKSLNPFSEEINEIIAEPGETNVTAFIAPNPCGKQERQ